MHLDWMLVSDYAELSRIFRFCQSGKSVFGSFIFLFALSGSVGLSIVIAARGTERLGAGARFRGSLEKIF